MFGFASEISDILCILRPSATAAVPHVGPFVGPSWAIYTAAPEMKLSQKVRNHHNSILALSPGPTHPGSSRFIPKRTGTPYSQPFFIAFLASRSQMSKPIQNPRPIFLENKGPKILTPFSTHLRPPSPGISISRSAEPYYIESRVIAPCFIIKSSLPWKDSIFLAQIPRFGLQLF